MSPARPRSVNPRRRLLRCALLGAVLLSAGCQDEYPIAATRCDRLCDVTKDVQCGEYNPAGCVAGCEQQPLVDAACYPAFDARLTCLETHRSQIQRTEFGCGGTETKIPECAGEQMALEQCVQAHPLPNRPGSGPIGGFSAE